MDPEFLYPAAITQCRDEPKVPPRPAPGEPRSAEAKAEYTKELHGAWGDCHDTVDATAKRKADYKVQYDRATESPLRRFFRFGK